MLCDAFRVSGVVKPLSWNPVPLTVACEILTLVPPVLVNVTVWVCFEPTVTLPKFSLPGLRESCPSLTPLPVTDRFVTPCSASLLKATFAIKLAGALGLNLMLSVSLPPAGSTRGRLGLLRAKYLVETEALLMVTDFVPEFEALTVRVLLEPTETLPKFRVPADRPRLPVC